MVLHIANELTFEKDGDRGGSFTLGSLHNLFSHVVCFSESDDRLIVGRRPRFVVGERGNVVSRAHTASFALQRRRKLHLTRGGSCSHVLQDCGKRERGAECRWLVWGSAARWLLDCEGVSVVCGERERVVVCYIMVMLYF